VRGSGWGGPGGGGVKREGSGGVKGVPNREKLIIGTSHKYGGFISIGGLGFGNFKNAEGESSRS